MHAGPTCPIRFSAPLDPTQSLVDVCLTAGEIEWRRWAEWQQDRWARKRLKKERQIYGD